MRSGRGVAVASRIDDRERAAAQNHHRDHHELQDKRLAGQRAGHQPGHRTSPTLNVMN
jgi:hypothetical protein